MVRELRRLRRAVHPETVRVDPLAKSRRRAYLRRPELLDEAKTVLDDFLRR